MIVIDKVGSWSLTLYFIIVYLGNDMLLLDIYSLVGQEVGRKTFSRITLRKSARFKYRKYLNSYQITPQ